MERHSEVSGYRAAKRADKGEMHMLFISLVKFRKKMTKADVDAMYSIFSARKKAGIRNISVCLTPGRIDTVRIFEAPDEKTVMKMLARNNRPFQLRHLLQSPGKKQ